MSSIEETEGSNKQHIRATHCFYARDLNNSVCRGAKLLQHVMPRCGEESGGASPRVSL